MMSVFSPPRPPPREDRGGLPQMSQWRGRLCPRGMRSAPVGAAGRDARPTTNRRDGRGIQCTCSPLSPSHGSAAAPPAPRAMRRHRPARDQRPCRCAPRRRRRRTCRCRSASSATSSRSPRSRSSRRSKGSSARCTFREGQEVKIGDLLFTVDPRPFEAALRQAEANLARDLAESDNATVEAERRAKLLVQGFVSRDEHDQAQAARQRRCRRK